MAAGISAAEAAFTAATVVVASMAVAAFAVEAVSTAAVVTVADAGKFHHSQKDWSGRQVTLPVVFLVCC
jgi:hypothetical protein